MSVVKSIQYNYHHVQIPNASSDAYTVACVGSKHHGSIVTQINERIPQHSPSGKYQVDIIHECGMKVTVFNVNKIIYYSDFELEQLNKSKL